MTSERWEQVERLFHAALEKKAEERATFLGEACGADADLRHEVESLLAEETPAGDFLDEPALHRMARVVAASQREAPRQLLSRGTRLGPYQVVDFVAAGGMGEVYEGRDTRLDRSVAIKVLPADMTADGERRVRFEREAKTIAGLNHPHICTLYDVGEHSPTGSGQPALYLVMEHLVGETLAARLEKGRVQPEQALTVAIDIADALAAAHRQGVIHRDLKPANVMLTKAGAKLLDFGLAKLTGHGERPAAQTASVTGQPRSLTAAGTIVGTIQYMAPEQLEGRPADARSDLWALGAILYEMLAGTRAFEGASAASLMGAIMEREPAPISVVQPLTPLALDRLVRQCLAKSPDDRPDTAHDVANHLRSIREASAMTAPTGTRRRRRALRTAGLIGAGLLLVMAGAAATWLAYPSPPAPAVTRVSVQVAPADEINAGGAGGFSPTPGGTRTALAWTPDGRALVFVGRRGGVQQLYERRLDADEARALPGTEGAQVPAVSADGWVAFSADGAIRKVPLGGGPVVEVAAPEAAQFLTGGLHMPPSGMVWDARGVLFVGNVYGPIWKIPLEGKPVAVTTLGETDVGHVLPWPLPGGRAILFTVRKGSWTTGSEDVVAQTLATGDRKVVLRNAADARYVPTGHLLFLRAGALFAVPFDVDRLQVMGKETPVLEGVAQSLVSGNTANITCAGQFAVATTGAVAWLQGAATKYPDNRALVTVDRRGQVALLPARVKSYGAGISLSPDGRRLAVTILDVTEAGVWAFDLDRGTLNPLARGGEADWPVWAPDGQRVVFAWIKDGRVGLAAQSADADGTSPPQVLAPTDFQPTTWTSDGARVAGVLTSGWDVAVATLADGKASVQPVWRTQANEMCPQFSPDGHWLAYESNVSADRKEIYVRPYPPGSGRPEQVSKDGGTGPAWNPNGRELFFVTLPDAAGKRRMMAVQFSPGPPPVMGRPIALFDFKDGELSLSGSVGRLYDVGLDGQRFYTFQNRPLPPAPVVTHINLIENWFDELTRKVPVRR